MGYFWSKMLLSLTWQGEERAHLGNWWNSFRGSHAPYKTKARVGRCVTPTNNAAEEPEDNAIIQSAVAACSQANIMALSMKMGPIRASVAVDTGATVTVLSERGYWALKRALGGNRWLLFPNNLNLMGVTSDPMNILGMVRLLICLGKGTSTLRMGFYVASNFTLPSDGLLDLMSMRAHCMVIYPEYSTVKFQGRSFRALDHLIPIAFN